MFEWTHEDMQIKHCEKMKEQKVVTTNQKPSAKVLVGSCINFVRAKIWFALTKFSREIGWFFGI